MNETKANQVKSLRETMDEINQSENTLEETESIFEERAPEIDVFELPPRSQIYSETESKFKFKISGGFVRFFAFLLIIIIVLILTYNYWGNYFF